MKRALEAFFSILRRRGPAWPFGLAARILGCRLSNLPRGLVVEASEGCTGGCCGCVLRDDPASLDAGTFRSWLDCRPAAPATIHFAGRHSDPIASANLDELVEIARRRSSMVSISTIALGMTLAKADLPVDRWVLSIPAATRDSWIAVKGVDRFQEAVESIRMVSRSRTRAMFEVVFTKWSGSAGDGPAFDELLRREGWNNVRTVHAFYDPSGGAYGRPGSLALDDPSCPYRLDGTGSVELKHPGRPCPNLDYLCIDAKGGLRPCPFAGSDAPVLTTPSREAWVEASGWRALKKARSFGNCSICP